MLLLLVCLATCGRRAYGMIFGRGTSEWRNDQALLVINIHLFKFITARRGPHSAVPVCWWRKTMIPYRHFDGKIKRCGRRAGFSTFEVHKKCSNAKDYTIREK